MPPPRFPCVRGWWDKTQYCCNLGINNVHSSDSVQYSNGNASETKVNKSFDNGVFFDIEAKITPSIVG